MSAGRLEARATQGAEAGPATACERGPSLGGSVALAGTAREATGSFTEPGCLSDPSLQGRVPLRQRQSARGYRQSLTDQASEDKAPWAGLVHGTAQ